jgi:hypothetical protein
VRARKTSRPMRPKPLIATLTPMGISSCFCRVRGYSRHPPAQVNRKVPSGRPGGEKTLREPGRAYNTPHAWRGDSRPMTRRSPAFRPSPGPRPIPLELFERRWIGSDEFHSTRRASRWPTSARSSARGEAARRVQAPDALRPGSIPTTREPPAQGGRRTPCGKRGRHQSPAPKATRRCSSRADRVSRGRLLRDGSSTCPVELLNGHYLPLYGERGPAQARPGLERRDGFEWARPSPGLAKGAPCPATPCSTSHHDLSQPRFALREEVFLYASRRTALRGRSSHCGPT